MLNFRSLVFGCLPLHTHTKLTSMLRLVETRPPERKKKKDTETACFLFFSPTGLLVSNQWRLSHLPARRSCDSAPDEPACPPLFPPPECLLGETGPTLPSCQTPSSSAALSLQSWPVALRGPSVYVCICTPSLPSPFYQRQRIHFNGPASELNLPHRGRRRAREGESERRRERD